MRKAYNYTIQVISNILRKNFELRITKKDDNTFQIIKKGKLDIPIRI